MSCLSEATAGITKLSALRNNATEVAQKLSSQVELIPITDGVQDELGQNTNSYLDEIRTSLSEGVINPLNQTISAAPTIYQKAKEEDDAIERARLAREKLAKEKEESEEA